MSRRSHSTTAQMPRRPGPPSGWRHGHDGELACPHRDCSVCPGCAAAHDECVDVLGAHYWVADADERSALRERVAAMAPGAAGTDDCSGNGDDDGGCSR